MNNKGQAVLSEYVMIFFVAVAALVAMTTFVQRGFEARIHDARNFAVDAANAACDTGCQNATGNSISYEYEPYYSQMVADSASSQREKKTSTSGSGAEIGAVYTKGIVQQSATDMNSIQLPSKNAN